MAEDEIKPGDVVELKSGGPPMTIERESATDPGAYLCTWFDGANRMAEFFKAAALKKHEGPGGPRNVSFSR